MAALRRCGASRPSALLPTMPTNAGLPAPTVNLERDKAACRTPTPCSSPKLGQLAFPSCNGGSADPQPGQGLFGRDMCSLPLPGDGCHHVPPVLLWLCPEDEALAGSSCEGEDGEQEEEFNDGPPLDCALPTATDSTPCADRGARRASTSTCGCTSGSCDGSGNDSGSDGVSGNDLRTNTCGSLPEAPPSSGSSGSASDSGSSGDRAGVSQPRNVCRSCPPTKRRRISLAAAPAKEALPVTGANVTCRVVTYPSTTCTAATATAEAERCIAADLAMKHREDGAAGSEMTPSEDTLGTSCEEVSTTITATATAPPEAPQLQPPPLLLPSAQQQRRQQGDATSPCYAHLASAPAVRDRTRAPSEMERGPITSDTSPYITPQSARAGAWRSAHHGALGLPGPRAAWHSRALSSPGATACQVCPCPLCCYGRTAARDYQPLACRMPVRTGCYGGHPGSGLVSALAALPGGGEPSRRPSPQLGFPKRSAPIRQDTGSSILNGKRRALSMPSGASPFLTSACTSHSRRSGRGPCSTPSAFWNSGGEQPHPSRAPSGFRDPSLLPSATSEPLLRPVHGAPSPPHETLCVGGSGDLGTQARVFMRFLSAPPVTLHPTRPALCGPTLAAPPCCVPPPHCGLEARTAIGAGGAVPAMALSGIPAQAQPAGFYSVLSRASVSSAALYPYHDGSPRAAVRTNDFQSHPTIHGSGAYPQGHLIQPAAIGPAAATASSLTHGASAVCAPAVPLAARTWSLAPQGGAHAAALGSAAHVLRPQDVAPALSARLCCTCPQCRPPGACRVSGSAGA